MRNFCTQFLLSVQRPRFADAKYAYGVVRKPIGMHHNKHGQSLFRGAKTIFFFFGERNSGETAIRLSFLCCQGELFEEEEEGGGIEKGEEGERGREREEKERMVWGWKWKLKQAMSEAAEEEEGETIFGKGRRREGGSKSEDMGRRKDERKARGGGGGSSLTPRGS